MSFREAAATAVPEPADSPGTIARYEKQQEYCLQQRRNDKTRRILAKSFSSEWADQYIDRMLFDLPQDPRSAGNADPQTV